MIADKILIVDDEDNIRKIFSKILTDEGFTVKTAENGMKALKVTAQFHPHIVLMDQNMPGSNGIETMSKIKEKYPGIIVIIITAHGEISLAVEAVKNGAYDYLEKPVDNDHLLLLVERAANHYQIQSELTRVKSKLKEYNSLGHIVSASDGMKQIISLVKAVCETDATVLITGESGTGKEVIANAIHQSSPRRNKPFIAVNCGAIPMSLIESELFGHEKGAFTDALEARQGKFEQAHGGTLFLDELGELPLDAQVKLLRVLEDKLVSKVGGKKSIPVDVRIISATNNNLEEKVQQGEFRLDLLYRLNIFTINMPPLRERKEDIPVLCEYFIQQYNEQMKLGVVNISAGALNKLVAYNWPGNVRDLQNAIQSALILAKSGTITCDHLPGRIKGYDAEPSGNNEQGLDDNIKSLNEKMEKEIIMKALQKFNYNKSDTAKYLKISRKTLFNKMKKYDF